MLGPVPGSTSPLASVSYGTTPNDFISTESDGRKHFTTWQGKLAATFALSLHLFEQSRAPDGEADRRALCTLALAPRAGFGVEDDSR